MQVFCQQGAIFSEDRNYRYKLWRIWEETKPKAMCVGLNPSTADEFKSDPTITILTKMLNKLGYGGFYMTNLFAWVSSDPKDLLSCRDPIGDNDRTLVEVAALCDDVIVCWGSFSELENRIEETLAMFSHALCFGANQDGTPTHPLAMMYKGKSDDPKLLPYKPERRVQKDNLEKNSE